MLLAGLPFDPAMLGFKGLLSKTYCFCVVSISWFNVGRYFWVYSHSDEFGTILMRKVVAHAIFLQSALGATVTVLMSFRMSRFFEGWLNSKDTLLHSSVSDKIKRRAYFTVLAVSFTVLVADVAYIVLATGGNVYFNIFMAPFWNQTETSFRLISFLYVLLVINLSLAWTFPTLLISNAALGIRDEFLYLKKQLKDSVSDALPAVKHQVHCNIEYFRRRHNELCSLTDRLDQTVSFIIIVNYTFNISILCVAVYCLMFGFSDAEYAVSVKMFLFIIILTSVQLFIITAVGTLLNVAVSSL